MVTLSARIVSPTGSYPETLVLYRMRPTVSVQVGSVLRGASDTAV